jgi:uncharacterized membrane protein YkoI
MKYQVDRQLQAKRTIAMVSACAVTVDAALATVTSTIGGTVFDVKLKEVNQRVVWRIKLLRDGERVKAYVDARSGLIVQAKAEVSAAEPMAGQPLRFP